MESSLVIQTSLPLSFSVHTYTVLCALGVAEGDAFMVVGEDDGEAVADALAVEPLVLLDGVGVAVCLTVCVTPADLQAWLATTVGVGEADAVDLVGDGVADAVGSDPSDPPPQAVRARTAVRVTAPNDSERARGRNDMDPPGKKACESGCERIE
ncbi:hypothetical protein LJ753_11765 [Arthrobacter sp. zg-Y20]|uniref:hypothetical protein n=1 Tax=unclassified Arthrobacter TaxID=235627 RepID=UPI001D140E76|nr:MULTISPECIES: hypothetical protein [unclassified Arthrobacter]MCC3276545.1 hypothetical protein [Arthrobacter sp. zg-Y20]MDK1316705.1 hypothetical protein [Arthrobacter sp. zg.Y20]WIB06872.1 hypothetical protein QNO06_03835 [Arthrobacter sp. zg-Y20]